MIRLLVEEFERPVIDLNGAVVGWAVSRVFADFVGEDGVEQDVFRALNSIGQCVACRVTWSIRG